MSGKIGIIIQARMSSSRFPGKTLEMIGQRPLVFYVVERMKHLNLPVIVATSEDSSDDELCEFLEFNNYLYFRGSLHNVLQRYIDTAKKFKIDQIVRITADNPLVDIGLLKKSLPFFEEYEYVDGIYPGGLIKGTGFELVSLSELQSIPSPEKEYQEHVTLWLREHLQESDKRVSLRPTDENRFRKDLFLSCDFPSDLDLLREIFKYYDYRTDISIKEVTELFEMKPALVNLNLKLHRG